MPTLQLTGRTRRTYRSPRPLTVPRPGDIFIPCSPQAEPNTVDRSAALPPDGDTPAITTAPSARPLKRPAGDDRDRPPYPTQREALELGRDGFAPAEEPA